MIGFQIGCLVLVTPVMVIAMVGGFSIRSSARLPLCLLATMPTHLHTVSTMVATTLTMAMVTATVEEKAADLLLEVEPEPLRPQEISPQIRRLCSARQPQGRLLRPARA